MKLYFRIVLATVSACLLLTGCRHAAVETRQAVRLVDDILSNPQGAEYQYLSSIDGRSPHGDIYLLDSPSRCISLSELFMTCDRHDNIDGNDTPDYLPDFAGETITSILDIVYSPYDRFAESANDGALREIAVKASLSALDTLCKDMRNPDSNVSKARAKMLVISSPLFNASGSFDVDTLLKTTGAGIPVVTLADAVEETLHLSGRTGEFAYLIDQSVSSAAALTSIFGQECHVLQSGMISGTDSTATDNPLFGFLDLYSGSGNSLPLSAFVYDSDSIPVDRMRKELDYLMKYPDESNFQYRKLLAKNFDFIDARAAIADKCFRTLRERNLFTHNIAFPIASAYITSKGDRDYVLTGFDAASLPEDLVSELERTAPKTYKSYVPNQHFTRGD